jgi:hypothetical protein
MSNWGVQRPNQNATIVATVAGADVTLTAGSDITGFTPGAALIAPFAGTWAYLVDLFAVVVMGATAPTALVIKLKTAGATVLDTVTVPPVLLANNAIEPIAPTLVGTASGTLYFPAGDTPLITFNAATTAATLKAGSRAVFSFTFVSD